MASATGIERNRTVLGTDPWRQARLSTTVEQPAAGRCLSRSSDWRVRVMAREPAQLKSGLSEGGDNGAQCLSLGARHRVPVDRVAVDVGVGVGVGAHDHYRATSDTVGCADGEQ